MNPIVRMMKRYIMPLKKALPLLFIGSLALVATTGCLTSTTAPTATPSVAQSTITPTPMATVNTPAPSSPSPIPSVTPSSTYEVQVGGSVYNNSGYFYATVTNSVGVYQTLHNQIDWFINGQPAGGTWNPYGTLQIPLSPGVQYTITASYTSAAPAGQFGTVLATSAPFYVTG